MSDLTPPDGYRHHLPLVIRYGDMDTLAHVNNAKYLTYCEHARINYFNHLALWDGSIDSTGLIVAKITVEFKMPLVMADGTAHVWTRCARLGNKSFDMEHTITRLRDGQQDVAATASIVMVVYDYQADQSVPIPDDWRARLTDYEPGL